MDIHYLSGFGNSFASEAVPGTLPVGRNSPQRSPRGLYTEVLSGTAFTAPRAENRSTWLYKLRPSAMHGPYRRLADGQLRSGPFNEAEAAPNRLRWNPFPIPREPRDFIDGLLTVAGSGEPASQAGLAVHVYLANRSMTRRYFWNADGELMFVPQQGAVLLFTELGQLAVQPGEIAVVPRGMKFRIEIDKPVRGYVCENYGAPFRLPELGPIGSQGLAQTRDFLAPVAAYEKSGGGEVVAKFMGGLWRSELAHSPLDRIGEDTEETDHREHQRERRERAHEHRTEAVAAGRLPRHVFQRHHRPDADQLLLVHTGNGAANRRRQHADATSGRQRVDAHRHRAQRHARRRGSGHHVHRGRARRGPGSSHPRVDAVHGPLRRGADADGGWPGDDLVRRLVLREVTSSAERRPEAPRR